MNRGQFSLGKKIASIIGAIGIIGSLFAINWSIPLAKANDFEYIMSHIEEIEHVLDDHHEVLSLWDKLDSLNRELQALDDFRDSVIHVIELLSVGKSPYDSIWIKGPSGFWYETTIEDHFLNEHNTH